MPKEIYSQRKTHRTIEAAAKKRVDNARKSKSVKGGIAYKAERNKHILFETD